MVIFVDHALSNILEIAAREAIHRMSESVSSTHFFWALYHADRASNPDVAQIIDALEVSGVRRDYMKAELSRETGGIWSTTAAEATDDENHNAYNRVALKRRMFMESSRRLSIATVQDFSAGARIPFSLEMERILSTAVILTNDGVVMSSDIVYCIFALGGGALVDLMVGCCQAFNPNPLARVSVAKIAQAFHESALDWRSSAPSSYLPPDSNAITESTTQFTSRDGKIVPARRLEFLTCHEDIVVLPADTSEVRRPGPSSIASSNTEFFQTFEEPIKKRIQGGSISSIKVNDEVGAFMGASWRWVVKQIILISRDEVNSLRFTRGLQLFVPFFSGYEAYILDQVISAFESRDRRMLRPVLNNAFKNRNVSRVLVQQMSRYDILWHWSTQFKRNRLFEMWGRVPFVGVTGFPATENFPSTRDHALSSIFRVVLGEGFWLTRLLTSREGLVTDNSDATAQNLAAESNGFESANRDQYGTYLGRDKTNEFRNDHRLPTDESIVRTFVAQPGPTITNNGVEHVIRQVAWHWRSTLDQEWGNFAHQRMEQLDPFEAMRFHLPVVLLQVSTLRGLNHWDSDVLAPFVKKLQCISPAQTVEEVQQLITECRESIIVNACGGLASRVNPMQRWLDAISEALNTISIEVVDVREIVNEVGFGIRIGYDVFSQVNWEVPSDSVLEGAIMKILQGKASQGLPAYIVHRALTIIPPKDKRTLFELYRVGLPNSHPAQLLLGRAKTLLARELRREAVTKRLRELSKGSVTTSFVQGERYWVQSQEGKPDVYVYGGQVRRTKALLFHHAGTNNERKFGPEEKFTVHSYVPVAEAVVRAQKAFMEIELKHGKKFSYNAFMEFSFLREKLRKLLVVAQLHCEALDDARLTMLSEIQKANNMYVSPSELIPGKPYYIFDGEDYVQREFSPGDQVWDGVSAKHVVKAPPQSMIVVGGGPTGLMTTIHCTENVLISDGTMRLYESRDAFTQGGATFERAQIVRLDGRWIAMLRYHLGTGYEDVYIPASGETDSHLGNTLPSQGFVEITIKDLENMLHVEVSRMHSMGLMQHDTKAGAQYSVETNQLTKKGEALRVNDLLLRNVNPDGDDSGREHPWKVKDLLFVEPMLTEELQLRHQYEIKVEGHDELFCFELIAVNTRDMRFTFGAVGHTRGDIETTAETLPAIYPVGTGISRRIKSIVLQCLVKSELGLYFEEELPYDDIKMERFIIDTRRTHVAEAIGKQSDVSPVHFCCTTKEPYGVCCISGLKVSMGMHNFGNTRWKHGIIDDIRSHTDQNSRIVGDFTKTVNSRQIVKKMLEYVRKGKSSNCWTKHFQDLAVSSGATSGRGIDQSDVSSRLVQEVESLYREAKDFRRKFLQTRFFETGDNYYLGMEFTREYDSWKGRAVEVLLVQYQAQGVENSRLGGLRRTIAHNLDRLWYDACLEVIRQGDVYNPGARHKIPRLFLVNSSHETTLGKLPVGEAFRLRDNRKKRYEVLAKKRLCGGDAVVRDVEGKIETMSKRAIVFREGNLTRGPDGDRESKVAIASFPVAHYVNHRSMRLNKEGRGYVFGFLGDEQSTPHFMRYSGLTGACINAMSFNNFIRDGINGKTLTERFRTYSKETNWSNSEVVTRGTGHNYGVDGFLRPGFSYAHLLDYLHSKAIEYHESAQDLAQDLPPEWINKIAASMVPMGMEMNGDFTRELRRLLNAEIYEKFRREVEKDKAFEGEKYCHIMKERYDQVKEHRLRLPADQFWDHLLQPFPEGAHVRNRLEENHVFVARQLEMVVERIIADVKESYLYNKRISSELENQPLPVDSIVDDFAVEAQNFTNSLTQAATFSAAALASQFVTTIGSAILSAVTPFIAFGTIAEVSRYKSRNEHYRVQYMDEKYKEMMKALYCQLSGSFRKTGVRPEDNPFLVDLETKKDAFLRDVKYYGGPDPDTAGFTLLYRKLTDPRNDAKRLRRLMDRFVTGMIADKYQVNSYLQQDLVGIYGVLEEMADAVDYAPDPDSAIANEAQVLFARMVFFKQRLEGTLQRGPIRFGFYKQRGVRHSHVMAALQYVWDKVYCARTSEKALPRNVDEARKAARGVAKPVAVENLEVLCQALSLCARSTSPSLRRSTQDLERLYHATRESYVSSLIILSATISFFTGIVFTIGNIFSIRVLMLAGMWSFGIITPISAVLSAYYLARKEGHLFGVGRTLRSKIASATAGADVRTLVHVRSVTIIQQVVTLSRMVASLSAAAALPMSLAASMSQRYREIPFYIAWGSLALQVISTFYLFLVEFSARYNFDPQLGEYVCEQFMREIETLSGEFSSPITNTRAQQVQEREGWEYVAREFVHKYRFDTVFAADRFGSIFQYIQGGCQQQDHSHKDEEKGGGRAHLRGTCWTHPSGALFFYAALCGAAGVILYFGFTFLPLVPVR